MTGERVYIIMRRVLMFACVCFMFMKGLVLWSDWRKSLHHYERDWFCGVTGERVYIIMRRVWMFACVCFMFMKGLVLWSDWRKSLHHYEKSFDM